MKVIAVAAMVLRGMVVALSVFALSVVALPTTVARAAPVASDPQAVRQGKVAYERARRHFEAEEYLAAAAALQEAYAVDPELDYLYQRGHALRLAGSCEGAIEVFEQVEAQVEASPRRDAVTRWIEHCREVVEAGSEARSAADTSGEPTDDVVASDASSRDMPARDVPARDVPTRDVRPRSDVLAGVLLGTGAAVTLTGIGLVVAASVVADSKVKLESEPDYERRGARVRGLSVGGGVALGVGLATVLGAVVRYGILAARRGRGTGAATTAHGPTASVAAGGLQIRF